MKMFRTHYDMTYRNYVYIHAYVRLVNDLIQSNPKRSYINLM